MYALKENALPSYNTVQEIKEKLRKTPQHISIWLWRMRSVLYPSLTLFICSTCSVQYLFAVQSINIAIFYFRLSLQ